MTEQDNLVKINRAVYQKTLDTLRQLQNCKESGSSTSGISDCGVLEDWCRGNTGKTAGAMLQYADPLTAEPEAVRWCKARYPDRRYQKLCITGARAGMRDRGAVEQVAVGAAKADAFFDAIYAEKRPIYYRGVQGALAREIRQNARGLINGPQYVTISPAGPESWSLSVDVAEGFARAYNPTDDGVILELDGTVLKYSNQVIAVFPFFPPSCSSKESEIILNRSRDTAVRVRSLPQAP